MVWKVAEQGTGMLASTRNEETRRVTEAIEESSEEKENN